MSRERRRTTERLQKRARARLRTERARAGYDEADLPRANALEPGRLPSESDPERDDSGRLCPADEAAPPGDPRLSLPQLLRSRRPIVPLRLVERDGRIEVILAAAPSSAKVRAACQELADFLRFVFAGKPADFTDQDWQDLLWGREASTGRRLTLLARLAIAADTRVTSGPVPFVPNDRSLKRFHAKFAALPDGTPFSLRLLLRDQRGKRARSSSWASGLLETPDSLLLMAVQRVLRLEESEGKARSDYEIGPELHRALRDLGVALKSVPTEEEVRTLRERRLWKGLDLFPKASSRQQRYRMARGASP
jgi:hypothetical protein